MPTMPMSSLSEAAGKEATRESINAAIAEKLDAAADLLLAQNGDRFRIRAYRNAAQSVVSLEHSLSDVLEKEGIAGLENLPGIGTSIARSIAEMLRSGRWGYLEHLRGTSDPVRLFQTIPGVGPALAQRLHEQLHAESLEALEAAVHDGRLAEVPGIGKRRAAMLSSALAAMLARVRPRTRPLAPEPPVELLLDVDREYRDKAAKAGLPTIAPKRFNPSSEAWLPILHTTRDGWHFTALFSNTARAHELGRTRDWVVLFFGSEGGGESQRTVVTETHGALIGKRVVRGREAECRQHHAPFNPTAR